MMLSPLDQLLVERPLLGSQLRIDLGAHPRLDGIELGPDPRPQRVGFRPVASEDRAHRVALGVVELQLAVEILDHRIRTTPAKPSCFIALGCLMSTPADQSARQEYRGQQCDGRELRSIQHVSQLSLLLLDQ
jgi:hypothetical protein